MSSYRSRRLSKKGAGSSRLHKRKRRIFILKIVSSFIFVCLLGYGVFSLVHAQSFTIADIQVEGSKLVPKSDILNVANSSLAGAYAWVFPKKNVLLAPRNEIKETLLKDHPEFVDVQVKTEGMKTMKIDVKERIPSALWCEGSISMIVDKKSNCYFTDNTGFIFSKAPTYSGNALPTFGGVLAGDNPIGQSILPETDFDIYKEFMKNISVLNMNAVLLYVQDNNQFEIVLDTGGSVLFSGTSDTLLLFENLKSIIEEQGVTADRQAFLKNLDYIDLRYGNKVYFKLK